MKSERVIPRATLDRLIRSTGAKRVSDEAADELGEILDEYGKRISKEAMKLAGHAGRKTIRAEDVALAKELIL